MRRIIKSIAILVLGILGLLYLFSPAKVIEFSQQDVDNAIKSQVPYVVEEGFARITVHAAVLNLRQENVVHVNTSFDASAITLEGEGDSNFETGIRYKNGNFYLTDLSKEGFRFEFSSNSVETIADVRSTLEDLLNREEAEAAANRDIQRANSLNRIREYAESQLRTDAEDALDDFLKDIPIYSLNNQGHWLKLAALALDDVTISEGKVTATLSFQTFIIGVVLAALSALLVMLVFLGPTGLSIWRSFSRRNSP
ncbi:MAG: hypothetical protein GQ535_02935 [Rhodobacteraceae bacterium]|nr:hypothetical protein [Paracoccaceae bacterium]